MASQGDRPRARVRGQARVAPRGRHRTPTGRACARGACGRVAARSAAASAPSRRAALRAVGDHDAALVDPEGQARRLAALRSALQAGEHLRHAARRRTASNITRAFRGQKIATRLYSKRRGQRAQVRNPAWTQRQMRDRLSFAGRATCRVVNTRPGTSPAAPRLVDRSALNLDPPSVAEIGDLASSVAVRLYHRGMSRTARHRPPRASREPIAISRPGCARFFRSGQPDATGGSSPRTRRRARGHQRLRA